MLFGTRESLELLCKTAFPTSWDLRKPDFWTQTCIASLQCCVWCLERVLWLNYGTHPCYHSQAGNCLHSCAEGGPVGGLIHLCLQEHVEKLL